VTLPLLISVPHAGLDTPEELRKLSRLGAGDIAADGDVGASEAYAFEEKVVSYQTTQIARAFIDLNRAEDDLRKDGVVKTHTCWDVPVYDEALSEGLVEKLLARYHRPYHQRLRRAPGSAVLGVDCHTMAAKGPPVGPDAGQTRPRICVSDGGGTTCPSMWVDALREDLFSAFETGVAVNEPFAGGWITRSHSAERPFVQLELSREPFDTWAGKRERVFAALSKWCERRLWEKG
jgi:formiminoglutamase